MARGYARLGFGPPDYELISAEDAAQHVAIEGVRSCVFSPHFAAIHPARLARGLAAAVQRKGVRLFERTKVRATERGSVTTDSGSVRAQTVVLAAEAYLQSIKGFKRLVAPIHGQMVATAPLGNEIVERTGITPPSRPYFSVLSPLSLYGQLTADGRVVLGAGDAYYFGSRLNKGADFKSQFVRRRLFESFPKLRDVPITHRWGGAMGSRGTAHPRCFSTRRKPLPGSVAFPVRGSLPPT